MSLSDREAVELFHLQFIRLLAGGREKSNYRIKGGCNLRFFFGSVRYSEDLDVDVHRISQHNLKDRVDSILGSKALGETLTSCGLTLERVSAPKQTATTQRWKAAIRIEGRDSSLPTKIEFSRREAEGESALEAVDARLLRHYKLMPVLACHYLLPTAIRQKVGALVGRREVQARDLFDLSLLLAKAGGELKGYDDLLPKVPEAIDRIWSLRFADYRGQVVAYLDPEHAQALASQENWEAMQLQVVSALESLRRRA